ncbi:MAG TPA: GNAT family N-acetyltransferase [Chloroflexia bacterium]|nr:GNAT family N-acetyltransferase [Chloroflexia bacterium]
MTEEIELKVGRLEDLDLAQQQRLVQIINEAFGKFHWLFSTQRTSLEGLSGEIGDSDLLLLTITETNEIVGVAYTHAENEELYFGMAAVDPARQGKGLGGQLLEGAEELARKGGFVRVRLKAVAEMGNVAYYARRGYLIVGQENMPAGEWDSLHPFTVATMQKAV